MTYGVSSFRVDVVYGYDLSFLATKNDRAMHAAVYIWLELGSIVAFCSFLRVRLGVLELCTVNICGPSVDTDCPS